MNEEGLAFGVPYWDQVKTNHSEDVEEYRPYDYYSADEDPEKSPRAVTSSVGGLVEKEPDGGAPLLPAGPKRRRIQAFLRKKTDWGAKVNTYPMLPPISSIGWGASRRRRRRK